MRRFRFLCKNKVVPDAAVFMTLVGSVMTAALLSAGKKMIEDPIIKNKTITLLYILPPLLS
jgi:hypothetical protein